MEGNFCFMDAIRPTGRGSGRLGKHEAASGFCGGRVSDV